LNGKPIGTNAASSALVLDVRWPNDAAMRLINKSKSPVDIALLETLSVKKIITMGKCKTSIELNGTFLD
jgi:hypothetical protein